MLGPKNVVSPNAQNGLLGLSVNLAIVIIFILIAAFLLAGEEIESYIHFANGGSLSFVISSIDASFRYPQDFSYIMQNVNQCLPIHTSLYIKHEIALLCILFIWSGPLMMIFLWGVSLLICFWRVQNENRLGISISMAVWEKQWISKDKENNFLFMTFQKSLFYARNFLFYEYDQKYRFPVYMGMGARYQKFLSKFVFIFQLFCEKIEK